ncbi:MAG: nucleotidyl transferase AbiEii/AbiGii toxin family protein [Planctomycetes bacterium]|nr:nucleotidyl transferase AbiEii/AbiGii toxin family protein [Planctomycetota bacterium]
MAGFDPDWTLTGGAALAGFYLGHRTTRDLDLFWRNRASLLEIRRDVLSRLQTAGFEVRELRVSEAFASLRVSNATESVIVDLIAEPVPSIEAPNNVGLGNVTIQVDTVHELLVNKLCSLLHRSELRDLVDIQALVDHGGDLDRAVRDAPSKDAGFSPLTLGYAISGWNVAEAARAGGLEDRATELERFRDELLRRVTGNKP